MDTTKNEPPTTFGDFLSLLSEPTKNVYNFLKDDVEEYEFEFDMCKQLSEEFQNEIDNIVSEVKTKIDERPEEKSEESLNIEKMTIKEILERLRCKCKELKDKYLEQISDSKADSNIQSNESELLFTYETPEKESTVSLKSTDTCKKFLKVKQYAKVFIDDILTEAEKRINESIHIQETVAEIAVPVEQEETTEKKDEFEIIPSLHSMKVEKVKNLRIEDFTAKAGREFIIETLFSWDISSNWIFCIDLIAENSDTCSDFYIYEVKWSYPTMSFPVPQATASIFFTIEVSRVKPSSCYVDVSYVFETERYKFHLDDKIKHEKFLENIMRCKLSFFKSLRM